MPITAKIRGKWRHRLGVIQSAVSDKTLRLDSYDTQFFNNCNDRVNNQNKDLTWPQSKYLLKIFNRVG